MHRRAKIVATVGPVSSNEEVLARLLGAGVDVVRLNLSHGTQADHRRVIETIRRVAAARGRHVPVMLDLMGPRYRLGTIAGGRRELAEGQVVTFGAGQGVDLPVEDPGFVDHLRVGERILIDNGLVELEIVEQGAGEVAARVLEGGPVSTRKGINMPDTELPFTITDKDRADLGFAVAEGADYLAVSFVGGPEDLDAVREVVRGYGGMVPLVAKLERAKAIKKLEETVQAADAVMVARGDLGVEVPLHQVPVLQKRIVAVGRRLGKPVIVATQMLESMMEHPRPTRAEVSDVANAVFDGADALMLSGETAAGQHPIEAVEVMDRVIREAEEHRPARPLTDAEAWPTALTPLQPGLPERASLHPTRDTHLEIPDVVAAAAVQVADRLEVEKIIAFSQSGFTARAIARYRPRPSIVAFTREEEVARRVQLVWGTEPLILDRDVLHHDQVVEVVDRRLLEAGLAAPGDTIIILMGDPIAERPLTNLMRVHRVRGAEPQ